MKYSLEGHGDGLEKKAYSLFLSASFPAYERCWLKHVVPLTNRPDNVHFKDDATLKLEGKDSEDLAIAQLHYTTLKHLYSVLSFLNRGHSTM